MLFIWFFFPSEKSVKSSCPLKKWFCNSHQITWYYISLKVLHYSPVDLFSFLQEIVVLPIGQIQYLKKLWPQFSLAIKLLEFESSF